MNRGGETMNGTESLEAVGRMQEYIEAHLSARITMRQLADAAGYSIWHAARMFKAHTGKAPFEYIRARRLACAAMRLRDGQHRVLDVALDFTFDSNEGFTRAFTRAFGISPGAYARNAPPIALFLPENVVVSHRAIIRGRENSMESNTRTIFAQVVERPARRLLLKRGVKAEHYFAYCEEVDCGIWGLLCSVKEAIYEPVGLWLPDHLMPAGTSRYVQGVELPLNYDKAPPEGLELIELPAATYMVFQGEPYEDEDFHGAISELWRHLETFDPALYGYAWDPQAAPRFQLAPMGYRGYIEARPVRRV
ncbi:MAG: helix-turn-helix domain-containing protein [Christensenellales bacterium]